MIKISEEEASFKGQLVRELIARVTSDHLIGQKFKNGEMRKKIVEPPWRCPAGFEMEEIHLPLFSMEYLTKTEGRREDRVLLQLHGGGYVGKIHNTYRSFAVLYAEAGKGMDVLSIDYRVAPENPFPAALEDAITAFDWLREVKGFTEDEIYLGGDSAGGGLCMALCHYLKDHGRKLPRGIVAMSPWTDMTASGPSYDDNYEKDPLFGKTRDSLIYSTDYRHEAQSEKSVFVAAVRRLYRISADADPGRYLRNVAQRFAAGSSQGKRTGRACASVGIRGNVPRIPDGNDASAGIQKSMAGSRTLFYGR